MKTYFFFTKSGFDTKHFKSDEEAIAAAKSEAGITKVLTADGSNMIYTAAEPTVQAIDPTAQAEQAAAPAQ